MNQLTKRQEEVLSYISAFIDNHMYPPTFREIALHFNVSTKCAYDHVKALEKKNRVICNSYHARSLELVETGIQKNREEFIEVPLIGHVAAGNPLMAEEHYERNLTLPLSMLGKGEYFALRVEGESMTDSGIIDGDLAIFKRQESAENGQIVAATIEDAVTLKRFYREKNRIRLQADNPAFKPIYTADVRILGQLVTLIRTY